SFGQGKVLGYFPAALISRDPLRRTLGSFIFDSSEQRVKSSQVPLSIKFERGKKQLDEKSGVWTTITPDKFEYSVKTDLFLDKLRAQLAENQVELPANLTPTSAFDRLDQFAGTEARSWYLLRPESEESIQVELGNRAYLEEVHQRLTSKDAGGSEVYAKHFN